MTPKRDVKGIGVFDRALKQLAKHFPKVKRLVAELAIQLENGEILGDRIPNSPYELYKVRLPNPDSQKGKSGGFRVIYYLKTAENILLVIIYSKSDYPDIPLSTISKWIEDYTDSISEDEFDE